MIIFRIVYFFLSMTALFVLFGPGDTTITFDYDISEDAKAYLTMSLNFLLVLASGLFGMAATNGRN